MSNLNATYNSSTPGYPGGYVPNPLIFESIKRKHCGAGESKDEANFYILENTKYFKVELVAPGFKRENFLVSINEKCCLSVTAMHTEDEQRERQRYEKQVLKYECINKEFALPENIDTDFISAEYKSGILSIWFLKTEKSYRRRATMVIVY